jgi:tartrate-resistant acid phosphatase type 5
MNKFIITIFITLNFGPVFGQYRIHENIVNSQYKICIIGDTGTGSKTQFELAKLLAQEKCHQVRLLGDVIYPDGLRDSHDKQFFDKFHSPFHPVIESDHKPVFHMIMGNHDYKQNPFVWMEHHHRFDYLFSPNLYYIEKYHRDDICFYNIDTTMVEHFKVKSTYRQHRWLKDQLKNNQCRLKLAFGHHPYKSSGEHGNASLFLKYFLQQHVIGKMDVYFAGHEHQLSYEGIIENTHLFISGSFAKSRKIIKNTTFASNENGFLILTINQNDQGYLLDIDFKVQKEAKLESIYQTRVLKKLL